MTSKELKIVQKLWFEFSRCVCLMDSCESCADLVSDEPDCAEMREGLVGLGVDITPVKVDE